MSVSRSLYHTTLASPPAFFQPPFWPETSVAWAAASRLLASRQGKRCSRRTRCSPENSEKPGKAPPATQTDECGSPQAPPSALRSGASRLQALGYGSESAGCAGGDAASGPDQIPACASHKRQSAPSGSLQTGQYNKLRSVRQKRDKSYPPIHEGQKKIYQTIK